MPEPRQGSGEPVSAAPALRDVRLDVLAAWRAIELDDEEAARRVLATTSDPESAFVMVLRLASLLTERWFRDEPGCVNALIDRLVAEEMRDEVDRL